MAIDGIDIIVVTLKFAVPPGMQPAEAGTKIVNTGLSVAAGLVPYLRGLDAHIEQVSLEGTRLRVVPQ